MNLINNLETLTQTHYDSGSLGGLAAVVHRVTDAGQHPLTILQADQAVKTIMLMVQSMTMPPAASAPGGPAAAATSVPAALPELHIDLSGIANALGQLNSRLTDLVIAASSYAVFHAPAGISGFAVQLHAPGAADQPPVFDSRTLGHTDVFATTIFRPGRYAVTNAVSKATAQLRVSYPVVGTTPYQPPDALNVQLDQNGFQPNDIKLMPAQGIVFHISNTQARISIDLLEPDDGPNQAQAKALAPTQAAAGPKRVMPQFRWVKPEPPKTPGS